MTKIYLSNIKLSKNNTTSIPKINMEGMFFGVGESIYVSNYKPAETLANAALTLPIQSTQPVAISGSNGSFTFSTVTFGNLNGVSFYTSNGSVVGSYTVPSVAGLLSNINVSAGSTSSNISALTFNNGNGVSFGFDGTNVTASVVPQSVQTQNLIDVTLGGNTSGTLALVSSGTLLFAGGNNITLSQVGNAVTISGANAAGAQTGISGVQVSNTTYTSGTITFQNANGISFGSSGANGISASYTVPTQSAQPVAISGSNGSFTFSTVTLGNLNGLSFYTSNGSVVGSYTVPTQTAQTGISGVQVSNTTYTSGTITFQNANGISFGSSGANGISASYTVPSTANLISRLAVSAGAGTSNNLSGITFANSNSITFGLSTGAGVGTITASVSYPAAQTGLSGIQVSNTTYTSGTVTFQNANGISFGSSGANGISASYTVPTQTNQTIGIYGSSQTVGSASSSTYDARSLSIIGAGIISIGNASTSAGGTTTGIIISASQSVQPVAISGSNGSFTFSTLTAGNLNGLSFYTSNGSVVGSYTVPTVPALSIGVSTGGNTLGNTGIYSGQAVFAGGNNITLSVSTAAGGAQTITISGANAGGAQTGISGVQVSNTTYTSGTITFQNANGISFGSSGANGISASYTVPTQTAQTVGIYASSQTTGSASSSTYDARSLSIIGAGIISIGNASTSAGGTTTGIIISASQSIQPVAVSGSNGSFAFSTLTMGNLNGASFYTSNGSVVASYTVPTVPVLSVGVSTGGNTLGNTGTYSGQAVFAGGNNITLSVSTAAGGAQTITISGANIGGAQTGISGLQVSNTTYTSGTVTFQNANGISFGSSGANGISASYTVPTQTAQTLGVYASSQTTGSASSSTYDARSLSIIGAGIISIGNASTSAGGTTTGIIISASQSVQPVAVSGSNGSFTFSTVTFGNLNGVSFYTSNGSVVGSYTVPTVPALSAGVSNIGNTLGNTGIYSGQLVLAGGNNITLSVSSAAGGAQTITISGVNTVAQTGLSGIQVSNTTYTSGTITFQNANGISFGSSGANGISASYTVPTQTAQTVGVYASSQTIGSASSSTYDARSLSIIGAGIISIGNASTSAGGTTTGIIISASQSVQPVAVSGSNGSFAFSTVTFGNLNGASFYTSNGSVVASYTVPIQTVQTVGIYASSQTIGSASSSTYDARSLSIIGAGIISIGNASTSAGGTTTGIIISASQSNQAFSAQGGSSALQTLIFTNSNNVSFSNTGGSVWGSYALNVSAAGGTSNALSGLTFSNGSGVSFGLSTGVGVGTLTASVAAQSAQTGISGVQVSNTTYTSGTITFQNANGISFGSSGANGISASYTVPTQTVQTVGVYASSQTTGSASSFTYDARSLSIIGAGIISIGNASTSAGGTTTGIIISASQSVQPVAVSGSNGSFVFSTVTFGNLNGLSHYTSNGSVVGSYTVPTVPVLSVGVSTGGNTLGNTGIYSGQAVFAGGNNITLSVSSAAGGAQTITISGPNTAAQTGISGVQVSNTTYTSGTITFQNANGISFGSSGANGISASYTVPVQTAQTVGVYASSQTTGSASSFTYDARSLSIIGAGIISIGNASTSAGGTTTGIIISASQSIQPVAVSGSNGSFAFSTATFGNLNGLSFYTSNGSVVGSYTVPAVPTLSVGVSTGGATSGNTGIYSGQVVFAGTNLTLSVSSGAAGAQTITVSAPAISSLSATGAVSISINASTISIGAPVLSVGVSTGGNTLGNTGIYSGQAVFAGGNNITLSVSTAAGGAQTITISGANAGGAQTAISGIQVSNTTYTSGTVTFQNANGISFGSSGANGISASYTVPTQSVQSIGIFASSQTTGSASSATYDARSITVVGAGIISVGNASTSAGGTTTGLFISATQSNQAVSAQGGSSAFQTLVFTNSNNVSFSNTNGSVWGSYALNVSAGGGTSNALSAITFSNSNGLTFGLSTGAGVGTLTASYNSTQFAGQGTTFAGANISGSMTLNSAGLNLSLSGPTESGVGISAAGSSQTVGNIIFSNSNGVSFGMNGSTVTASAAAGAGQSLGVSNVGNTLGNTGIYSGQAVFAGGNNITLSVSSGAAGAQTITIVGGAGGAGGVALNDGVNTISTGTALLSGVNMTFSINGQTVSASVPATSSLLGTGAVSIVVNANTISIGAPVQSYPIGSRYEPELFGNAAFVTIPNGTLIVRPFELDIDYDVNKIGLLHSFNTVGTTSMSLTASISGGSASSGTGTWGFSGTQIFFSRVQTNVTAASYNSIISAYSNTFTSSAGYSASVSWSTNASSMTASWTTSAAVGFVSNINSNGSFTTGSVTSSGSSTFSATSTAAHTTGTTVTMSFLYANFSGPRNVYIPNYALSTNNVPPGEYWLGLIQSTTTGTTNFGSLSQVVHLSDAGKLFYTAVTNSYMEIGNSVAFSNSGEWMIFGSYGTSANTTTAIPLTNFTTMASNASLWFALDNRTQ